MKIPSKYYNTIEIEDEDSNQNLQSVRKHTSLDFDPYFKKNLPEQLINRFIQEIK